LIGKPPEDVILESERKKSLRGGDGEREGNKSLGKKMRGRPTRRAGGSKVRFRKEMLVEFELHSLKQLEDCAGWGGELSGAKTKEGLDNRMSGWQGGKV